MTGRDPVADGNPDPGDDPGHRGRDVHGGLVGLQGDQRVLRGYRIAGRHVHLDHRHVGEVAEVGHRHLDDLVDPARRAVAGRLSRLLGGFFAEVLPRRRPGRIGLRALQPQHEVAGRDPVSDPEENLADGSRGGRGDVHRGLVRLQGDQRILGGHGIAGSHVHFDDRDTGEVADVRDADVHVRLQGRIREKLGGNR
jgi:hypothetical protein